MVNNGCWGQWVIAGQWVCWGRVALRCRLLSLLTDRAILAGKSMQRAWSLQGSLQWKKVWTNLLLKKAAGENNPPWSCWYSWLLSCAGGRVQHLSLPNNRRYEPAQNLAFWGWHWRAGLYPFQSYIGLWQLRSLKESWSDSFCVVFFFLLFFINFKNCHRSAAWGLNANHNYFAN